MSKSRPAAAAPRDTVPLSHANPEDNELSSKYDSSTTVFRSSQWLAAGNRFHEPLSVLVRVADATFAIIASCFSSPWYTPPEKRERSSERFKNQMFQETTSNGKPNQKASAEVGISVAGRQNL